ncbi:MAG: nicotinate (nicotinamide) nucleotide adenylyltransferase, partial [Lachnospiraceae bacterium]
MKIGIMGGTFDPLHNGHVMLAQYAYRMFALDEVWFLPNGMPPHKSKATIESLTKHRVEMIQAAISQYSYFKLCLYETRHKQISYSYQTMEYFKEQFPQNEFYFIIGADSLFAIEHWKYPQRLLSTCTVLAACRDDKGTEDMQHQIFYLNQKYQAEIKLLRTPGISI